MKSPSKIAGLLHKLFVSDDKGVDNRSHYGIRFGRKVELRRIESFGKLPWHTGEKKEQYKEVRLQFLTAYPAFPNPEGDACVESEYELLKFVFGEDFRNNELLRGIELTVTI